MAKVASDHDRRMVNRRAMLQCSMLTGFGLVAGVASAQEPPRAGASWWSNGQVRRILTGENAQGRSYVVSDELVPFGDLWKSSGDMPLGVTAAGQPHAVHPTNRPQVDPPHGGTRLIATAFAPAKDPKPTIANRVGFHRTATVDYNMLVSGQIVLLLEEQEVTIRPGDVAVVRNVMHAWRNDGIVPAQIFSVVVEVG